MGRASSRSSVFHRAHKKLSASVNRPSAFVKTSLLVSAGRRRVVNVNHAEQPVPHWRREHESTTSPRSSTMGRGITTDFVVASFKRCCSATSRRRTNAAALTKHGHGSGGELAGGGRGRGDEWSRMRKGTSPRYSWEME